MITFPSVRSLLLTLFFGLWSSIPFPHSSNSHYFLSYWHGSTFALFNYMFRTFPSVSELCRKILSKKSSEYSLGTSESTNAIVYSGVSWCLLSARRPAVGAESHSTEQKRRLLLSQSLHPKLNSTSRSAKLPLALFLFSWG